MKKSPLLTGLMLVFPLLLCSFGPVFLANAANEGPPIQISIEGMDQQNPDVAALADLNLWFVVWEDWRTAADPAATNTGADIWGQFVNGDGTLCGAPFLISDGDNDGAGDSGNQTFPRVAYDLGDRLLLVAWQDTRQNYVYARSIEVTDCATYTLSNEFSPSYNPVFAGATLLSRTRPRVAYDPVEDQFFLTWVEHRDVRKRVEGEAFGCASQWYSWTVGDTSFVGYCGVDSASGANLAESVTPTIVRTEEGYYFHNMRLMSYSQECEKEVITFEFFNSVNNPDVAVDPSTGNVLLVWEAERRKLTVTNEDADIVEPDCGGDCLDGATSKAEVSDWPDESPMVHVFGSHQKEWVESEIASKRMSAQDSLAYRPSVQVDPVTGRFLVAWEDLQDYTLYTKIYGQLVYSGGGLYNTNFMIGFQDTNGDGALDEPLQTARQTGPYVGYDYTNQRFFVAWQDARNGSISIENLDIYGQYVDAEGSLRGSNYLLSVSADGQSAEGNQYSPAIAFNLANHLFLSVWKDARNFATTRSDVYGQRFTIGQPQLAVLNTDNSLLSPALLDFGSRVVGEAPTASFKIRNTGDIALNVTNMSITGPPFNFVGAPRELIDGDDVGITLVPSAEVTVEVAFVPTEAGSFQGEIMITSDAGAVEIVLQGIGLEQAPTTSSVSVNPSEISFGSVAVNDVIYRNITLQNDGTSAVTMSDAVEPASTGPFAVLGGPSSGTIDPGEIINFLVKFEPTEGGNFRDRIVYIFRETNPIIIELTGTGSASTNPPEIRFSTTTVSFGGVDVGDVESYNVLVTNEGGQPTTVLAVDEPADGYEVTGLSSGTTISPGETKNVVIRFFPDEARAYEDSVAILFSHRPQPMLISVAGTGIDEAEDGEAVIVLSTDSIEFPDTIVGQSRSYHMTVTNTGTASTELLAMDMSGGVFGVNGIQAGAVVGSGEIVHVILTFAPDAEEVSWGEIRFYFKHQMEPMILSLQGRGVSEETYQSGGGDDGGDQAPWLDPSLQRPEVLLWVEPTGEVKWEFVPNDYVGTPSDRYLLVVTPWLDPWTGGFVFYSRLSDGSFVRGLVPEAANWELGHHEGSAAAAEEVMPPGMNAPGTYYVFFGVIMKDRIHAYYDWISWVW